MIYFVRHGSTKWNDNLDENGVLSPKCQGVIDLPLNENGINQANQTQQSIADIEFDKVLTSPLTRARQTLDIIYNGNTPKTIDNRLIERDFGEFEGLTRKQFDFKKFWTLSKDYQTHKFAPHAETIEQVQARVKSLLLELKPYEDKNVLLVSHGGVGCVLLSFFMSPPESDYLLSLEMPHAGAPIVLNPKDMKI